MSPFYQHLQLGYSGLYPSLRFRTADCFREGIYTPQMVPLLSIIQHLQPNNSSYTHHYKANMKAAQIFTLFAGAATIAKGEFLHPISPLVS